MLKLDHRQSNKIDSVFVIALFTVFAITAFLLILIGAKQYRYTAEVMDENYEIRTISSYLTEKIRQNDTLDAIYITELEGVPALALKTVENSEAYITYIYYYDNALQEIMVTELSVFSLASGQKIVETGGFSPEFSEENLLKFTITTRDGYNKNLYLTLHSPMEKEEM